MNKPVLFFGKVVDQFDKPVAGAAVVGGIAKFDPAYSFNWGIGAKEFRLEISA